MVLHPTSQIRDWKAPRGILATTKRFVCWAVKWDVITSNVVSPSLDHSIGHSLYPERVPSRFNMTQKTTCPQPFRTRAYREDPYPSISYDFGTRNITPKSHSSERLCAFTKEQWEIFEKAFNLILHKGASESCGRGRRDRGGTREPPPCCRSSGLGMLGA